MNDSFETYYENNIVKGNGKDYPSRTYLKDINSTKLKLLINAGYSSVKLGRIFNCSYITVIKKSKGLGLHEQLKLNGVKSKTRVKKVS